MSQLVCYHMLPYHWLAKTEERYKKLFGLELYEELLILHEADVDAH